MILGEDLEPKEPVDYDVDDRDGGGGDGNGWKDDNEFTT